MNDPSTPSLPIPRERALELLDSWCANMRQLARLGLLRPVRGSAVKVDPDYEVRLRVPLLSESPVRVLRDCGVIQHARG